MRLYILEHDTLRFIIVLLFAFSVFRRCLVRIFLPDIMAILASLNRIFEITASKTNTFRHVDDDKI